MRKTKRTLRKAQPLEKELLKLANDLHRINARLITLAEKVADREFDSAALQKFLTTVSDAEKEMGA